MKRSSNKDLIESVYAVALEPERYEELTDIWKERLVEALKRQSTSDDAMDDDIQRSLNILNSLNKDETAPASRLSDFAETRFAVLAVNSQGEILEGNGAAVTAYGDLKDADLTRLPYDEGSLDALRSTVRQFIKMPTKPTQMIRAIKQVCGGASLISVKAGHVSGDGTPYVLVQTSDFIWPPHLLPILESSFGLTQAESSIIRLMTEGCTLADIARERASSLATVRSQVRSIYEKTGTHSQTELVRMAIAFAALGDDLDAPRIEGRREAASYEAPFEPAYPRQEDRYLLPLSDGRVLDYSVVGDPDGLPVIFTHCAFFGDVWTAKITKLFKEKGLKIISPARAFYQRSSPCPDKASPLETYVSDVGELIAHMKLDRFLVMTRNIGSIFGFAITRQFPEKAIGILSLSAALPFKDANDYANAEPNQRFLAAAVLHFPKLLELFVNAGQIYYTRVPARKFIEKSLRTASADFYLMDDPEIMAAVTQGMAHSGANGAKAFLHSYKDVRAHTYETVVETKIPIVLMIGAEDKAPRSKIAEALYADRAIDKLIRVEGVAEFFAYAKPELLVKAISEMWSDYG